MIKIRELNKRQAAAGDHPNITFGWFFVSNLNNSRYLINLNSSLSRKFTHETYVSHGVNLVYLTENEFFTLKRRSDFETIPSEEITPKRLSFSPNMNYNIYATDDWAEENACKKMSTYYFQCFNFSNQQIQNAYNDNRVLTINPAPKLRFLNRFSVGLLQNNIDKPALINGVYATERTLTNKGLTGNNQIIQIVDTGLDINNTFFYDANQPVSREINLNHRKVIKYFNYYDNFDGENGHGTHVSGTACGEAVSNDLAASLYNGVAPKAKIHFVDIGNSRNNIALIPNPKTIQEDMSTTAARIQSSSWSYVNDDKIRSSYDEISFQNQDNLYVASAGNDAAGKTVFAPGNSKNFLTVGALDDTTVSKFLDTAKIYITNGNAKIEVRDPKNFMKRKYGPILRLENLPVSTNSDTNGAAYIQKSNSYSLVQDAKFSLQISYVDPTFESVYPILCTRSLQELNTVEQWTTLSVVLENSEQKGFSLASYSSWGPTEEGIVKPEVIAPGTSIYSAKSLGIHDYVSAMTTDQLLRSDGTSMATPMVAGIGILIRQFFVDGYYPSLSANSANSMDPSGFLVKAMIINGCRRLGKDILHHKTGFGMVTGIDSMGFGKFKGLRVTDKIEIGRHKHLSSTITTTETQDLSITICYCEPSMSSSKIPLNIGLNLVVEDSKGKSYFANGLPDDRDEEFTTSMRVYIENAPAGTYKIHIYSQDYESSLQTAKFAIAASGGFSQTDFGKNPVKFTFSEEKKCPSDCNTGSCDADGFCQCPYDYRGTACQTFIPEAPSNKDYLYNASSRYMNWVRTAITDGTNISYVMYGIGVDPLIALSPYNNVKLNRAATQRFSFSLSIQVTTLTTFHGHWIYWGFMVRSDELYQSLPIKVYAQMAPGELINSSLKVENVEDRTPYQKATPDLVNEIAVIGFVIMLCFIALALVLIMIVVIVRKKKQLAMLTNAVHERRRAATQKRKNTQSRAKPTPTNTNTPKPNNPNPPMDMSKSKSSPAMSRMHQRRLEAQKRRMAESSSSDRVVETESSSSTLDEPYDNVENAEQPSRPPIQMFFP